MTARVRWMDRPEAHDYAAAEHYLSLTMPGDHAKRARRHLEAIGKVQVLCYHAKDILRASGLPLLPADSRHVAADLAKIEAGDKLSPVLLVRGRPLVIADGYHRVCAAYHTDENCEVPCVLA